MVDPKALRSGDVIAKFIYAKVEGITPNARGFGKAELSIECRDLDTDLAFHIQGDSLIAECLSPDHYTSVVEVTQTELVKAFVEAGAFPFTVAFQKADGAPRTLRGVLVEHEDLLGRSMVRDFDVVKGSPLRQVDHRTIQSLVLRGVKYTRKEKQRGNRK